MTLKKLQQELTSHNFDAYIITRGNMFLGQDVLEEENKLFELTKFSGSAGTLIVRPEKAFLLVDGRYELQAKNETNAEQIQVICTNESLGTWMNHNFTTPLKIAYNPWCHSINEVDYWFRVLKKHTFIEDTNNLIGSRIAPKEAEIFEHNIEFCGVTTEEKISYLTRYMAEQNLDAYFISECDAVSWLLNLRSDCLADTPILRAFALVNKDGEVSLFTNDMQKLEEELIAYHGKTIGLSYAKTPKKLQFIMKHHNIWLENLQNPIENWKATKNEIELSGIKKAHLRDAVAITKFLHWLEQNWQNTDELGVVQKLRSFREAGENFYSDSFGTIAAFGANAAIVHYQPNEQTTAKLTADSVLLLDSGTQYFDGTTDITRTIAIGSPSEEIKNSFTQVLKAHIAVANAYFPAGTGGNILDALSRATLWKYGKEYHHGTGHGVGCFLAVHEGPFSLSSRNTQPLASNMITSIEPGYYQAGEYGIRIENLAQITPVESKDLPSPMLKFEPLTLVPIDKRLINKYLLSETELNWLNDYHQRVYQKLKDLLEADVQEWLQQACVAL